MKKKLIIICSILLLLILLLSGCNGDKKATETSQEKKINFDSDVLLLVDSSLDVKEDNGEIYAVEVTLYFKNNLNSAINVTYVVDFCDKNDDILYSKTYRILNIPANYQLSSPDIFTYDGEKVMNFDHININIENYEIIK